MLYKMGPSRSFKLALLLQLVFLSASLTRVAAYTEKENLDYIERIIKLLNNRDECELPAYSEVDEMQSAFAELEQQYGSSKFESMLSDDMRLVRNTVLDQWASFQQRMSSDVVIRAAKKRSFICKIEEYQLAKYRESVCTRFKNANNKITDRVFEKNPIVRYIKHLETNEVVEQPEKGEEQRIAAPSTEETPLKTVGEAAGEDQSGLGRAPEQSSGASKPTQEGQTPTETSEGATMAPVERESLADGSEADDRRLGGDGSPEVFSASTGEEEREGGAKLGSESDQYLDYDPLEDIPVPKSTDSGDEELKDDAELEAVAVSSTTTAAPSPKSASTTASPEETSTSAHVQTAPETTTTVTPATSITEEPLFDEFGAAFVDIEDDDYDLARVVRLPEKDWEFDQVFGYFKWPDEGEEEPELMHLDRTIGHAWADFLLDPIAFDQYMDSLTTTTPRPKLNGAVARRRKQEFFDSLEAEERRGQTFGWAFESTSQVREKMQPPESLRMPPVPKDRWVKMLNNNVCKLGYNKDAIKRTAKGGYRTMKSWLKSRVGDEDDFKF